MRALPVDEIHAVGVRLRDDHNFFDLLAGVGRIFDARIMRAGAIDFFRQSSMRMRLDAGADQPHVHFGHCRWRAIFSSLRECQGN